MLWGNKWLCASVLLTLANGNNFSQHIQERKTCHPGFYCPLESITPVPCPKGTYGPSAGSVSIDGCLKCPPQHYCPRPEMIAPLPCGPVAHQLLVGQDTCICPGEGQIFQTSDGLCQCTLDYHSSNNGHVCAHKLYDICRDGKTRSQYGHCLDRYQWSLHCSHQVCRSAEDYQGYNGELGLCVCRQPAGRAVCGGLCRRSSNTKLKLQCRFNGEMELVWNGESQVSAVSGRVLEMPFEHWDSQGTLLCSCHPNFSRPVYVVQSTEAGFLGLSRGILKEIKELFPIIPEKDTNTSSDTYSDVQWEVPKVENNSHGRREMNLSGRIAKRNVEEEMETTGFTGVLNPTTCLHLGDILLFTVSMQHYPQYDVENLYNTNYEFDWGSFRQLTDELTLSWTPPGFFSVVFSQPGVYVFTLSSNQHKHMYVRVMPAVGQCYEPGPFFPSIPHHVTRMGIRQRRNLLLRPDWLVTGTLLFGAVLILCLCVTLLILFREYGWPAKEPIRAQYRLTQLGYHMDDYSSKGSQVISLRKVHRNLQARMTHESIQPVCAENLEEFWDYEHQVDLEAFSTNIFYSLLLKQSLSVTSRLGQLTSEVKELYSGVLGKLQLLHPPVITEEKRGEGYERMRTEVEREVARRKSLASQLRTQLDNQLEVLRRVQQAQRRVHSVFTAQLRECTRLLTRASNNQPPCEQHQQTLIQRVTSLIDEVGELISAECQHQGCWGLLGEGTGAKLLCPDTGTVLTKDHIFGSDGSLGVCGAVHCDSVTGLIRPNVHTHMLLSSGHTMAVPPDFFIHPQTGRVLPIAGHVAFDPASSSLVCTTDTCADPVDHRKWDSPLLPFIPYPTSCHSDRPIPSTRLKGLRPGQRLQFGAPMADPETGVPVPILAVTIHPHNGLLYPLGGVHVCPFSRLPQPIQIGSPMLDPKTGNIVLTVGVSLDVVTARVLPVGGVLLAESFVEPLSGRMVRVGGANMRAGQLVPHAGGYQALLDSKVLTAMLKVAELLKTLSEELSSETLHLQHLRQAADRRSVQQDLLAAAKTEFQLAWGRSRHCQLQLQTRLEMQLDWVIGLQENGGILGEMPCSGSHMCVPALLGMEYPDPTGSGLKVPVLGSHVDLISGVVIPLAGTMEDPDGKGLVPVCYGSQTVDPVTGLLAPVVGARFDMSRKTVVPVTASYWLTMVDHTDSVQVEVLQKEVCARNAHWEQQRQKEEDILSDLDSALIQCLLGVTEVNSWQVLWSGLEKQLREAGADLQDSAHNEAQRKAAQHSHLALILPPHVLHILTSGDEEEWDQHCLWYSELLSVLDKLDVCMEQLQRDQEKWASQGGQWTTTVHAVDREIRQRELWEQCSSRQAELEASINPLHCVRQLSQLRADTAQAVLCRNFWYKEYGLMQWSGHRPYVKVMDSLQQKALPLLERLNQLLEDKQPTDVTSNSCRQKISGLSVKQMDGLETSSRIWTASVPVGKGISTQSLREPVKAHSQDTSLQANSAPAQNSQGDTTSSGIQESEPVKEPARLLHIPVPVISGEEWSKLLQLSPLFQLLKGVELQLKCSAHAAGLLQAESADRGKSFVDILEAQWDCEGELIPLDSSLLNPREFLVYQHGLFLLNTLHNLKLTPSVSLQIAATLPHNNYFNNAFRNSFFYQESQATLFVRRQRLQSVGGFSLLLLHCLSHVKLNNMSSDCSPAFQRLFFKMLQACLAELFQARLGMFHAGQEDDPNLCFPDQRDPQRDFKGTMLGSCAAGLLERLHRPSRGLLSPDEIETLQRKHRETSVFCHLEGLLREKSSEDTNKKETV
ncbi:uncharacterized protein si:dkey-103g5.4 [Thalassophryne amazonica]|uniref:uncharacterized protein si:dkey-103g5.4 n=1 Tax=Thalassophryne amazonica TaxID=390379 RepID=UPI0014715E28|nr:uncharacterized protein si:dkey-103g5.4 [Thalassophryne amazonica]